MRGRVGSETIGSVLVVLVLGTGAAQARSPATVFSFGGPVETHLMVDTDGDSLPDDWERLHGLDPECPADAVLDLDGDGLDAHAEWQANTDPWCADSDDDGLADGTPIATGAEGVEPTVDTGNRCRLCVYTPAS